jgi:hypothetical protein
MPPPAAQNGMSNQSYAAQSIQSKGKQLCRIHAWASATSHSLKAQPGNVDIVSWLDIRPN